MTERLNATARKALQSVLKDHPDWRTYASEQSGELELAVPAPGTSQAGHLIVQSHQGDLWIRFAPPYTGYSPDDCRDLRRLVKAILADEVVFVTVMKGKQWVQTTLSLPKPKLRLRTGQTARILSWSGAEDQVVKGAKRK